MAHKKMRNWENYCRIYMDRIHRSWQWFNVLLWIYFQAAHCFKETITPQQMWELVYILHLYKHDVIVSKVWVLSILLPIYLVGVVLCLLIAVNFSVLHRPNSLFIVHIFWYKPLFPIYTWEWLSRLQNFCRHIFGIAFYCIILRIYFTLNFVRLNMLTD